MTFEELQTPRLRLLKITPEVHRYIHTTLDDAGLMAFFGLTGEEALQKEKDKYAMGLTSYNHSFVNFLLIDKETGSVIGACGFHMWYTRHNRAEMGYAIHNPTDMGKGLMSEAVKAVIGYGFNQMGLHRIEALTATWNKASMAILKKFGFTYEGTLRQHYNVNGKMEDSIMYSLLQQEFR